MIKFKKTIPKKILTILFLVVNLNCFATEWGWYYIYVQTDYIQGPWKRTDLLNQSKYKYLHPKLFEDLFGSEPIQMASAILYHLKKETPERYKFNPILSLSLDTVIIQAKDSITDFDAVKNELTASFILNGYDAVKIIQRNKAVVYFLKDISVPYMDLVSPTQPQEQTVTNTADSLRKDSSIVTPIINHKPSDSKNNYFIWLIISGILNIVLLILIINRRNKKSIVKA